MKRILYLIVLLVMAHPAFGAEMTQDELMAKIEQGLSAINDLSWHYTLGYRPKDADKNDRKAATGVTRGNYWYKKPGLGKNDSQDLYLPGQPEHHYISKLEGDVYNSYKILEDGSVQKTSYPAGEWQASGATPEYFYEKIKERIAQHIRSSIEYQPGPQIYILKFDAPDEAAFEIDGRSWIPYMLTVFDERYGLVVMQWSRIRINNGLTDDLFRFPEAKEEEKIGDGALIQNHKGDL